MKVLGKRVGFLVFFFIVVNYGSNIHMLMMAAERESELGHQVETLPEQQQFESNLSFITYLAAIQRIESWEEHVSVVSKIARDVEVLGKFGLASIADIQLFLAMELEVDNDLKQFNVARDSSYEEFTQAITNIHEAMGSLPIRLTETESTADSGTLAIDKEALSLLQQAMLAEKQAFHSVTAANIQRESGIMNDEQYLAVHKTYIQANLLTIDAREAFHHSLIYSYVANTGAQLSLLSLMTLLDQQEAALSSDRFVSVYHELLAAASASVEPRLPRCRSSDECRAELLPSRAISFLTLPLELPFPPIISHTGEVYIPLRAYAEALQYEVLWEADLEQVTLKNDLHHILITINQKQMYKDELEIELSAEPIKQYGATYVPLSFVSSVFNLDVYWDEGSKEGLILR